MEKKKIEVRTAAPDDAVAIAALLRSIGWFAAYEAADDAAAARTIRSMIEQALAQRHATLLVAVDKAGTVLGYCAVHWLSLAILLGKEGYISELFIADAARGQGVGGKLLDRVTELAGAEGCKRLFLLNNRNRASYAQGFYPKQGWIEQPEMARFVLMLNAAQTPDVDRTLGAVHRANFNLNPLQQRRP